MSNPSPIAQQQAFFQRIAGSVAGIAFWQHNPVERTITRTKELDAICGLPDITEDEAAKPIPDDFYVALVPLEDQELLARTGQDMMAEGVGALREVEHRIIRPDGEERVVMVREELTTDDVGVPVFRGSTLDVTDIRAKELHLDRLIEQKNILLGEVNHRVKNSLQLVSSILSLQARSADEALKDCLLSAAGRVHAISAVHASFYQGPESQLVDISAHLRSFCRQLCDSFCRSNHVVRVDVIAEKVFVHADVAVPLSVIVNELMSNAMRHGQADKTGGRSKIEVRLSRSGQGKVCLSVSNSTHAGETPLHATGQDEANTLSTNGLGLQLVKIVAQQIGADVDVNTDAGWRTDVVFDS